MPQILHETRINHVDIQSNAYLFRICYAWDSRGHGGRDRAPGWSRPDGGAWGDQPRLGSQAAARADEARASQASWMTSASSVTVSSAIRLPRIRTEGWPSKCGVVKNGEPWSWTRVCF